MPSNIINNKYRINGEKNKGYTLYYPIGKKTRKIKIILAIILLFLSLSAIGFMFITFNINTKKIKELENIEKLKDDFYYFKLGEYVSDLQKDIFWVIIGSLIVISILLITYLTINLIKK